MLLRTLLTSNFHSILERTTGSKENLVDMWHRAAITKYMLSLLAYTVEIHSMLLQPSQGSYRGKIEEHSHICYCLGDNEDRNKNRLL